MKYRLIIIFFATFYWSCQPPNLEELPYESYLALMNDGQLPDLDQLIIRDEYGNKIDLDSLSVLHRIGDYEDRFYQDKEGKIVEYRLSKKPEFRDLSMDCGRISAILDSIYIIDQSNRSRSNYNPRQDYANLELVVNILEKCGMPEKPGDVKAAFMIIQHNHLIHQKKYIDNFRQASNDGYISKSSLAMMEDRILMTEGKPQLYGTQVRRGKNDKEWSLYKLYEPEKVDQRRAKMNLGPINDYLKIYNIDFDIDQVKN